MPRRPVETVPAGSGISVIRQIGSILPPTGISGAVLLSVMTMSYLSPSLEPPLAADQRRLGDVLRREGRQLLAVPVDVADDGVEVGRGDRRDGRLRRRRSSAERLSTSTATSNSAWTKPIGCVHCLLGRALVGRRRARSPTLPGQRRLERMARRPPDLGGEVVAVLARAPRPRPGTGSPCRSRRPSA